MTIQFQYLIQSIGYIVCQLLQVVQPCKSVICSHLELGHNFLESILATYGFARFFTKIPHGGDLLPQLGIWLLPFKKFWKWILTLQQWSWRDIKIFSNRVLNIDSHDRVSECSMMRSNRQAVKSISFLTLIVLLLVDLLNVASMFWLIY